MTSTYGVHLTMRIANIERNSALDGSGIGEFLKSLVQRVNMRVLAGPLVVEEQGVPEKRGWSGVVILYESHAAIHSYPELGEAFVDIFSCKEFNVKDVTDTMTSYFGSFTVVEKNVLDRGVHWGPNISNEMDAWLAGRK